MSNYFSSSVGKKQIVAITGLLLIGFLIGHLAGNLFIFLGPESFNAYAKKLASLRPGLYFVEAGLAFIFLIHIALTISLVRQNRSARSQNYAVANTKGERSFATKVMPFTGLIIFAFLIVHLLDFTFSDHHGAKSLLAGKDYGLYGLVYNSLLDPTRCALYILAMFSIGFHLTHGVQSCMQTFGFNHPKYSPMIKTAGDVFALVIAFAYSSIPICIYFSII